MNKITHPSVNNLIRYVLGCIPETSHGTYNRTDPTAFSKGATDVTYNGITYNLYYNDCTWGIEFEIRRNKKIIGNYYATWDQTYDGARWSTTESVISRRRNKGILKLLFLFKSVLEPIPIHEPEYFDDPMGCPSMYI